MKKIKAKKFLFSNTIGENHTINVLITGMNYSGIYNENPSDDRVFTIAEGKIVEINDLTIKGGKIHSNGACIYNPSNSTLELTNVNISNSISSEEGKGGGIYNNGTVYLVNSTFIGNVAYKSNHGEDIL